MCRFWYEKCPKAASNLSQYCDNFFKHAAVKLISVQNTSTLIPLMLQLSLHRDELLAEALREVLIARLGQARSRQLLVKRCMRRHDEEYVLKL